MPTVFRYAGPPVWFDGGQNIVQFARDAENNRTLYKVDLKSGEVVRSISVGNLGPGASLSPDGRRAYAGGQPADRAKLAVIDIASGARTQISACWQSRAVSASPDGRSVAFVAVERARRPGRTSTWRMPTGANVRAILTAEKQDQAPTFGGGLRWSRGQPVHLLPPGPDWIAVAHRCIWRRAGARRRAREKFR